VATDASLLGEAALGEVTAARGGQAGDASRGGYS